MRSLTTLKKLAFADAMAHGLWEGAENAGDFEKRCAAAARIQDEVLELMGAADDPVHYAEELADVVIISVDRWPDGDRHRERGKPQDADQSLPALPAQGGGKVSTPWRINRVMDSQPCLPNCPDRTWECKRTCPKWAVYEAKKQEIYAERLEIQWAYDYTSPMYLRVQRRRVTDYKQGRRR